jgi:hypothetical protein
MQKEAHSLGQALLDHHHNAVAASPPGRRLDLGRYTIRYGVLCDRAGVPHLTRNPGPVLRVVAEWCEANGYPPIVALAVNETGMPGSGYDGAGECEIVKWPQQVEACIRFTSYPAVMPP